MFGKGTIMIDIHASQEEIIAQREAQRIQDNMDQFYDASGFRKRKEQHDRFVDRCSKSFVQGIAYD